MSSVYDYLEERYGKLPGDEKTLRNYIGYLIQTEKLTLNEKIRTYTKVPELPFGYQMQLDFGRVKGIGKSEAINLLDCRWIDNRGNVLFFGVATAEKGYKVCFERITNLIKLLKTAEIQKTSEYRIRRIMKSDLMIIDKIGYTPIEKREANLFFNMISEMYEKLSIIVTS
ncbi:MAG: ATP-binding protein, partial [Deltaproteobacteria bacterium]|nr:ATP-binding protein [Candidatus Tharpellaceae bacterium]